MQPDSKTPNPQGNDFDDILYESRLDRFKPILKGLAAFLVVIGLSAGAFYYFANKNAGSGEKSSVADGDSSYNIQNEDDDTKLYLCYQDVDKTNPTPETNDPDFYPKLIASYDQKLACYDKYPDASNATGRASVETLRQGAIDSSGSYRSTYLSSNPYSYEPSQGSSRSQAASPPHATPDTPVASDSPQGPSEWELNKAEFDVVVACANKAYSDNPTPAPYGSIGYYQQRDTQLKAQLACTDGAKYDLAKSRRAHYQSSIATNQQRLNDAL